MSHIQKSYYVTNENQEIVWQQEFNGNELEIKKACIDKAYELKGLPGRFWNYADSVTIPVEVEEIFEYGDLKLQLPIGSFRLQAMRLQSTDSKPVKITGTIGKFSYPNKTEYFFQPDFIEYADGTRSGFLGAYPRDLEKISQ